MRLLISYLKEKLPVIGVYAVMLVIFCILLWLKEVPFDEENVTRFATNSGFTVTVTEQDGDFYLALKK